MSVQEEAPSSHPEFSPLSIARTLWKRKVFVLALWLTLSVVVIGIVLKLPAVYSSEALIMVDSQKIPDKFVASTVNTDLQDRIATISQQILSVTRLKKIIEDFNLYQAERKAHFEEDILEKMRKDINVKIEKGYNINRPGAFRVSYQGESPEIVAQVARQLASLFIDENLKTREVQAEGTSEFIDTQLQGSKKRLDDLEKAVSDFKLKYNGELPQQENSLTSTLTRLQMELESNRDAISRAQQNKVMLQNELSGVNSTLSAFSAATRSAAASSGVEAVISATGEIAVPGKKRSQLLQEKLDALLVTYRPTYPPARDLAALVAHAREEEAKAERAGEEAPRPKTSPAEPGSNPAEAAAKAQGAESPRQILDLAQINQRISTLKAQGSLLDQELELRKADHDRIVAQLNNYEARLSRLPIREQEMAQVGRDYEIAKANYRSLLDKQYAAQMSTDMERRQKSERFTLLDAPRVPEKPLKPNRLLLGAGGSLFALVLGLALAFVRERRRDVFLGEWELPAGVLILGRLPNIAFSPSEPAAPGARPQGGAKARPWLRMAILSSIVVCAVGAAVGWFVVTRQ